MVRFAGSAIFASSLAFTSSAAMTTEAERSCIVPRRNGTKRATHPGSSLATRRASSRKRSSRSPAAS